MREQRDERQMNSKNYTDGLIGGKIYTLGGAEETGYLQQVAAYINEKIDALESQEGIRRQSEDYRHMVLCLNLADDCFKARENARVLAAQKEELEKQLAYIERIYEEKHSAIARYLLEKIAAQ